MRRDASSVIARKTEAESRDSMQRLSDCFEGRDRPFAGSS